MATTKYQVLYRYINEATNAAITNSTDNEYEAVCEFYVDPGHKIFSSEPTVQGEATDEQQAMISYGTNSENPKNNMLFAYDGTKKIKHKKWVEEVTGYVVKDWKRFKRSTIGNQGDFTKEFTTINAARPEDGGIVVCTEEVMKKYFKPGVVIKDNSRANAGTTTNPFYTEDMVWQIIEEYSPFSFEKYSTQSSTIQKLIIDRYGTTQSYYVGPVAIGANNMKTYNGYYAGSTVFGQVDSNNLYGNVNLAYADVETTAIPGHYEEQIDAPYLIIDTYKRIQLSPWFVNCTCGSLESALAKAKTLVEVIGMNNVKIIKIVPFDQFIKIK